MEEENNNINNKELNNFQKLEKKLLDENPTVDPYIQQSVSQTHGLFSFAGEIITHVLPRIFHTLFDLLGGKHSQDEEQP